MFIYVKKSLKVPVLCQSRMTPADRLLKKDEGIVSTKLYRVAPSNWNAILHIRYCTHSM